MTFGLLCNPIDRAIEHSPAVDVSRATPGFSHRIKRLTSSDSCLTGQCLYTP